MSAQRTHLGSFAALVDITAVAADPEDLLAALENDFIFQVGNKLQVSLLVVGFDRRDSFKQTGDIIEAFLTGDFRKALVHFGPLIVFAGCCVLEVRDRVGYAVQLLKPNFCMLLLVVRSLLEDGRYLLVALFLCGARIEGILFLA